MPSTFDVRLARLETALAARRALRERVTDPVDRAARIAAIYASPTHPDGPRIRELFALAAARQAIEAAGLA